MLPFEIEVTHPIHSLQASIVEAVVAGVGLKREIADWLGVVSGTW